jgi:transcriptional regulator with XRE-family HTH domain
MSTVAMPAFSAGGREVMQSDSDLGRAIQVRRAELGLKRKDLAQLAFLSYPYLSELENGSKAPSAKALAQLASALQLSSAELLARAEALGPSASVTRDLRPVSKETLYVPERWRHISSVADAPDRTPAKPAASAADSSGLDRIAELVAVTVRAELNAWARTELPALVRDELSRLVALAEKDQV